MMAVGLEALDVHDHQDRIFSHGRSGQSITGPGESPVKYGKSFILESL
jgi:hypothetical protein